MPSEPLLILILAVTLSASPIAPPLPEPGLQHWYTVSVPQETGVYEMEVFAPTLPALFAQPQIVGLGEPPRLTETPEPGTAVMIMQAIIWAALFILAGEIRKAKNTASRYRKALEQIQGKIYIADPVEIARQALEGHDG